MTYTIKTTDGKIARATATRPYKAAWIARTPDGNPIKGWHSDFTSNPKPMIGMTKKRTCSLNGVQTEVTWTYERVVPEEK